MRDFLKHLPAIMGSLWRRDPSDHLDTDCGDADWLPPALGPMDWSNSYFLTMADSESHWYFERGESGLTARRTIH
jgi:hypothetical protein